MSTSHEKEVLLQALHAHGMYLLGKGAIDSHYWDQIWQELVLDVNAVGSHNRSPQAE